MDRRMERVLKVNPSARDLARCLCIGGTIAEDAIREIYEYPPHVAAHVMQAIPDFAQSGTLAAESIRNQLVNGLLDAFVAERDSVEDKE